MFIKRQCMINDLCFMIYDLWFMICDSWFVIHDSPFMFIICVFDLRLTMDDRRMIVYDFTIKDSIFFICYISFVIELYLISLCFISNIGYLIPCLALYLAAQAILKICINWPIWPNMKHEKVDVCTGSPVERNKRNNARNYGQLAKECQ